jgi:hypothetical protein
MIAVELKRRASNEPCGDKRLPYDARRRIWRYTAAPWLDIHGLPTALSRTGGGAIASPASMSSASGLSPSLTFDFFSPEQSGQSCHSTA